MASREVNIHKMPKGTMAVTLKTSRQFRIRVVLAIFCFRCAGWLINNDIEIEHNYEDQIDE